MRFSSHTDHCLSQIRNMRFYFLPSHIRRPNQARTPLEMQSTTVKHQFAIDTRQSRPFSSSPRRIARIAALRSGDYEQTNGALRSRDAFCCLGVLCDLHLDEGDQP